MKHLLISAALCTTLLSTPTFAQHENHEGHPHNHSAHLGNAPASIMGDHIHPKGKWMASYRFMRMDMNGSRNGTNRLSPTDISGNFANPTGVGPSTLRVVPTSMTTDMHMLGTMYGLTDNITLMAMATYLDREMDHTTFAGPNPALEIGSFTTRSRGFGDTKLASLFNAYKNGPHAVIAKAGLSLPTGSIRERDDILNPMGVTQNVRLPYAMQLGSGTFDFEPALTYTGEHDKMNWGAQYMGQIRLGENSADYQLGDRHRINMWAGYGLNENIRGLFRLGAETEGQIDGDDPNITGPVQTADPDNYGGERIDIGLGLNLTGTQGWTKGQALNLEATLPLYQDLNGPQLERDYALTAAYKVGF